MTTLAVILYIIAGAVWIGILTYLIYDRAQWRKSARMYKAQYVKYYNLWVEEIHSQDYEKDEQDFRDPAE